MISELASATDVGLWATISLLTAIGLFALVVLRIVGLDAKKVDLLSRLPLEDHEPEAGSGRYSVNPSNSGEGRAR